MDKKNSKYLLIHHFYKKFWKSGEMAVKYGKIPWLMTSLSQRFLEENLSLVNTQMVGANQLLGKHEVG